MRKLGFNVHVWNDAVRRMVQETRPPVVLVLSSSANGSWGIIDNIKLISPETTIIYRPWSLYWAGDLDHFDQWKKQGMDGDVANFMKPIQSTIDRYGDGVVYHLFNETGESDWGAYVLYQAALVRAFAARGLRVCALNQGPGNPSGDKQAIADTYWERARPLFDAIRDTGYRSILGFHDYFTGLQSEHNWIVGRYEWMQEALVGMGYDPSRFKIAITEYGFEKTIPGYTNGGLTNRSSIAHFLQTGEHTADTIAGVVAEHHHSIYDKAPMVIGTCFFTLGRINDQWKDFDLAEYPGIMERLILLDSNEPNQPEEIPVTPTDLTVYRLNANVNIRKTASISGVRTGTLPAGSVVLTDALAQSDGYDWRHIPAFDVWMAIGQVGGAHWVTLVDMDGPGECPDLTLVKQTLLDNFEEGLNLVKQSAEEVFQSLEFVLGDLL